MGHALKQTVTYESTVCCVCGLLIFMPEALLEERRKDKRDIYCINGHRQGFYGPNKDEREIARLKRRLESSKKAAEWEREGRERAEKSLSATRGVVTKLRKRFKAGVCPCCHRSFKQLRRHMRSQHPDFNPEEM